MQYICMDLSYTQFYLCWEKDVENIGKTSLMPLRKVCLSLHHVLWNWRHLLDNIL
jgi:hypothetical protein